MEFGVLGSTMVVGDAEELAIGGAKRRLVLCRLVVDANHLVAIDRLVDDLWGGMPPASAAQVVHSHVSHLRRALGVERIETASGGYRLIATDDEIDARRFSRALEEAKAALAAGDPAGAAALLQRGLGLWRGPALADAAGLAWAQVESARLEELREVARELLLDARLALGQHDRVTAEAEAAVAEYPLRERLWAVLITALYRSGRQADALRAYQRVRRILAEELGIEPGRELVELERRVLQQDPGLAGPPVTPTTGAPTSGIQPAGTPPPSEADRRPSGVVTFLLTDIVGSTRLWESSPDAMPDVLDRHDELVRAAVEQHRGAAVKTRGEGDSTFSAFQLATDAAAAALDALVALLTEPWPHECPVHVRMALHTGEALERDGDYFGRTVNRVARLRGIANPDQILVSQATAQLLLDRLPAGAHLEELGSRQLRDFERPEMVYRLATAAATIPAPEEVDVRPPAPAERRQLTVAVCGFAEGADFGRGDPEELQTRQARLRQLCREVVGPLGGYITRGSGNTVMALFGYPNAHDDDAVRAVRAALHLVESDGISAGIDTGLTIVGPSGSGRDASDVETVGETPVVATRLQEVAAAQTVVLSDTTRRLVQGWVELKDLGRLWLRGLARDVALCRATRMTPAVARIDAAARRGLTPFVGRGGELDVLVDRWQRVQQGGAEVVIITGEPGIGKSRLARAFAGVAPGLADVVELRCSPDHRSTPLYPVSTHLSGAIGTNGLDGVRRLLADAGVVDRDALALVAAAAGMSSGDIEPSEPVARRGSRTVELLRPVLAPPGRRPLLLVIEDLHWADPTTLELCARLIEPAPLPGVLAVFTCRPEFAPPWPLHAHVSHLVLSRLTNQQVESMVRSLAAQSSLEATTVREIIRRTEGVPLFVEEFTASLLGNGRAVEGASVVPSTLQDSLMARLDRVGTARRLMQLASVLGREFDEGRLVDLLDDPTSLAEDLDALVAADLLYRRGMGTGGTFCFKHSLIRDAAYESLLRSERRRLHTRVAEALEAAGPELAIAPEVVARHWTEAGDPGRAIRWWRRASRTAEARGALSEAVDATEAAMALVDELPSSEERDRTRMHLTLRLIPLLNNRVGAGDERMVQVTFMATELARRIGSPAEQVVALTGAVYSHINRCEYPQSLEVATELAGVAGEAGDDLTLALAYQHLGTAHLELGHLADARNALDEARRRWRPELSAALEAVAGNDVTVALWSELAWVEWHEGHPDQALTLATVLDGHMPPSSHPWTRAFAEYRRAQVHWLRREPDLALTHAERCLQTAREAALEQTEATANIVRGWALSERGRADEGVSLIRDAWAMMNRLGTLSIHGAAAMLAAALRNAGRLDLALAAAIEGEQLAERTAYLRDAVDLWRLEGEIRAAQGEPPERTDIPVRHALEVARAMGSRMVELRALVTLSRLRVDDDEVRTELAAALGGFTEGFETPDLREAVALVHRR